MIQDAFPKQANKVSNSPAKANPIRDTDVTQLRTQGIEQAKISSIVADAVGFVVHTFILNQLGGADLKADFGFRAELERPSAAIFQ